MHGVDWPAMRKKYAQFLPHLTTRADLTRVIQWMGSELSVGHHFTDGGAVQIVPIADDVSLRTRAWIEGNLRKVDSLTQGRVAYIYVPNTAEAGADHFRRYFYPQAYKDAVIVDERFNGGGQLADYYLDILRRPALAHWTTRYGEDFKTPVAAVQGPKVLLINEAAASGGDFLAWAFRKLRLGPLVGQRTWGGVVGNLGLRVLLDGGTTTAPNLGMWTADEGWLVENVGVPPDIAVEQTPAEVIAGHDPQLEAAIKFVMTELRKHPPERPKRPPFPDKTRRP